MNENFHTCYLWLTHFPSDTVEFPGTLPLAYQARYPLRYKVEHPGSNDPTSTL